MLDAGWRNLAIELGVLGFAVRNAMALFDLREGQAFNYRRRIFTLVSALDGRRSM